MSNPRTKAERSKAKDKRQQPAPDRVARSRSKKHKPVVVEYRMTDDIMKRFWRWGWTKFGSYRDLKTAEKVIKDQMRKHDYYEMRIKDK